MKGIDAGAVLIVDDNPHIVRFAVSFFRCRGVRTIGATSGQEAIELIRKNRVILMITDLHMPGMNGFELVVEARKIAPHIIVAMATGDPSPEVVRRAGEAGIAKVFAKPFRLEEVFGLAGLEELSSVPAERLPSQDGDRV